VREIECVFSALMYIYTQVGGCIFSVHGAVV
jgi:hypothetical protein